MGNHVPSRKTRLKIEGLPPEQCRKKDDCRNYFQKRSENMMRTEKRRARNLKRGIAVVLILLLAFGGVLFTFGQSAELECTIMDTTARADLTKLGLDPVRLEFGDAWIELIVYQNTPESGANQLEWTSNVPITKIILKNTGNKEEVKSYPDGAYAGTEIWLGSGARQLKGAIFYSCVPAPTTYTVTFDSKGGSAVDPITGITPGATVTLPADPTKENNTFEGWYTDDETFENEFTEDTPVNSNLTVYAKWVEDQQPVTYTVTFDSKGGSAVDPITGITPGATVTLPADPTKENNTFEGWYTDDETFENEFTEDTPVNSNLTVYAKWVEDQQPVTYTVTFDSKGGSAVDPITGITPGATVTLPADPTKENNTFEGWYTDDETFENEFTEDTPVNSNLTVYAKWTESTNGGGGNGGGPEEPDMVTVTFIGNGGTPAEQTKSVEAGEMVGSLPSASRPGRTFVRWDTKSDGTGDTFTATTVVESDITVYAIWRTPSSSSGSSSRTPAVPRENVPEFVEEILEVVVEPQIPEAAPIMEIPVLDEAPLAAPPVLPQTGDAGVLATILSGLGVSLSGLAMKFRKKGKDDSVTTLFK
jgi:uncharacterized repeat protein (TIGR02543 family)/LPXTG-motif cell wall-anchored protein